MFDKGGIMMEKDTLELLGDCTAGIEMAVATLDGVLPNVKDQTLRQKIQDSIHTHRELRNQTIDMLQQLGGQEKQPNPVAKSMSWLKTNTRFAFGGDDTAAADLVANGCDMGVRSLCKSRNRYAGADRQAKYLAEQLINCEERLSAGMRPYL